METKNQFQEIKVGLEPTEEDEFFLAWGKESLKDNIKLVNDLLVKFITINAAFAGGAVVQNIIKTPFQKSIVISIFLIGLIIGIFGIMPYQSRIDLSNPDEIKEYKEKALKTKNRILHWSIYFTIGGIAWVIILIFFGK